MELEIEDSKAKDVKGDQTKSTPPRTSVLSTPHFFINKTNHWKTGKLVARFALYLGLALFLCGKYFIGKFESSPTIDLQVRTDPKQEEISDPDFEFTYHDKIYEIHPVASYDISGLIVSHNDISSITDAYHTSSSVDFRDLCVVWGANVGSGVFRRLNFWSEAWTCHYHTKDQQAAQSFNQAQLSNNHLLSANERVREIINSMRIGDQIRLQGMLINYNPKGAPEMLRSTSTIREDTGNGACEVLWVDSAQILRRSGSWRNVIIDTGFWLLVTAIVSGLGLFFVAPVTEYMDAD